MEIPHFLYRLFNESDETIYIGITGSVNHRMRQHRSAKPWWNEVSRMEVEQHPSLKIAEKVEREQISTVFPRYNIIHIPDNAPPLDIPRTRGGRPPLENAKARPRQIRFTEQQDKYIAAEAEKENVSFAEYVRARVLPKRLQ